MKSSDWDIVTKPKLLAFAFGVGLLFVLIFRSEPGFKLESLVAVATGAGQVICAPWVSTYTA